MIKKTLAGLAAVAMLFPGSLVKAQVPPTCSFYLTAKNGDKSSGYVLVYVNWDYSKSRASVKPTSVTIYNYTGRSITFINDRWQNSSGTTVQRGIAGEIPNNSSRAWYPTAWIPKTENPYVQVSASATTRPGLGGSTKCRNY